MFHYFFVLFISFFLTSPSLQLSIRCLSQTRWNTNAANGTTANGSNGGAGGLIGVGDPSGLVGPPLSPAPPCRSLSAASSRGQLRRCVFCAFTSSRWSALSAHYTEVHNVAKVAKSQDEVSSAELEPGCSTTTSAAAHARALSVAGSDGGGSGGGGMLAPNELSPMSTLQRKRLRALTVAAVGGGGGGGEAAEGGEDGASLAEEAAKTRKLDLPSRLLHHGDY